MVNTNKLKGIIVEKYGTQSEFAKAIGIDRGVLSLYINNNRDMSYSTLHKIIKVLDIPDNQVVPIFFTDEVPLV